MAGRSAKVEIECGKALPEEHIFNIGTDKYCLRIGTQNDYVTCEISATVLKTTKYREKPVSLWMIHNGDVCCVVKLNRETLSHRTIRNLFPASELNPFWLSINVPNECSCENHVVNIECDVHSKPHQRRSLKDNRLKTLTQMQLKVSSRKVNMFLFMFISYSFLL